MYCAQQTVFLNFDVIELTFSKEGKEVVIPTVMSPIDIVNGFEDLNDYGGCLDDFIGTAGLILGVLLVAGVVVFIIKAVDRASTKSALNKIKRDKPKRYRRRRR